jgi:lipoic acid synthetase|tara:strand:- start:6265 stop:7215 length:951 start_codon:yes stop_codon:yes gene_type:complete
MKHTKPDARQRSVDKVSRVPVKFPKTNPVERLRKPHWIRAPFPGTPNVAKLKNILREQGLHTVCEEANCPNLGECFNNGTATFMIMGDLCTRRCPFCDVAHGRPKPLDENEPHALAVAVKKMGLTYVVITSVDRDDLRDGGASHFADCIKTIREQELTIKIEILVPDFRGRKERALEALEKGLPDVFNHNLETIPRLYRRVRPGADYKHSLNLLKDFFNVFNHIPTKSGLMLGLGETKDEVISVMRDLRHHDVQFLTLGQYLQPSPYHLPVERYVTPAEFEEFRELGLEMGYTQVASGPMVRSSYHADEAKEFLSV